MCNLEKRKTARRGGDRAARALLIGLFVLAAGCAVPDSVPEPDHLWIERIRVVNEDDGLFGLLDIEVHLFDDATGEHLGCSRLEPVDVEGVTYELEAYFVRGGRRVEPAGLSGRQVLIQVIEDDANPCPARPTFIPGESTGDDPVGTSAPIAGDALGSTGPLRFDDVALLELGLHP